MSRAIFSISNLAGIKVAHVDAPGASYVVTADPARLQSLLSSYAVLFVPGLIIFGLLGFLIGSYFAGQALSPLIAVTGALRRFAGGDFTPQHISTRDRSEIGNLAEAFNGAAAQVSAAFDERRRVEEYIRQFVADAGHELRTPLTVIRGYLDVLRRGAGDDPVKRERAFKTIEAETTRMRQLIEKLIVLARLERPEPSTPVRVDVAAVARNVAEAAGNVPDHPSIELDLDDGAFVMAEEAELHEAIANLVDNARKYGAGSLVRVEVQRTDSYVAVRVIDAGPGIPAEEQTQIFDRFYRGESQRDVEGSGLGLAIAVQAVARAHGTLRLLESRPGKTVFEIKLPTELEPGAPAELVLGKKPKSRPATEQVRP
jgi:two-component system OmpR family sensor kinase